MKADLHVHSTASDGTLSPVELVALALQRGLDVLAITDHDSVAGVDSALAAASGTSLTVVPAVELSATRDGRDVHVLAYFVDHTDARLLARLSDLREARLRRAELMVDTLREAGYLLTLDEVLALSAGGAVGRSHVAQALVRAGHASSIQDAFQRYIGRGRPFYVAKDTRPASEIVGALAARGALPVLAHPGVSDCIDLVEPLLAHGLRGVEAYHADHTHAQRDECVATAARLGLLVTGGTDYHGPGAPNPELGSVEVPSEAVAALLDAGVRR
jgi:predicted metal-dependent phosphoesterase TrpH